MAKIIKLNDKSFNNEHPNGINIGFNQEVVGDYIPNMPVIGENYFFGSLRTSQVTDFKETENSILLETKNSTYVIFK